MPGAPPKVFISYSHETVEHQERVLGLANRLRADGIDAEIDQYNPSPPEGWPLWCERQIDAADIVLMVCTETYDRRVSGDEQQGEGLGVVWEARIIRQLLYDASAVSDKFVPVLFFDTSPEHIPTPIKGGTRYIVDTEDGYESLFRRIARQPDVVRPVLGAMRALPARHRQWPEGTMEAASSSLAPASSPTPGYTASVSRVTPAQTCANGATQRKHPVRFSLFLYISLWLLGTVDAYFGILPDISQQLTPDILGLIAPSVNFIVDVVGIATVMHMLLVYLSFDGIEANRALWENAYNRSWVNSRAELLLRFIILVSLLLVGGELCTALDRVDPYVASLCRHRDDPSSTSLTASLTFAGLCSFLFFTLLLWDSLGYWRANIFASPSHAAPSGGGYASWLDFFSRAKTWLMHRWHAVAQLGRARFFASDVIAMTYWLTVFGVLFMRDWLGLKANIVVFIPVVGGVLYISIIFFRLRKLVADRWQVIP